MYYYLENQCQGVSSRIFATINAPLNKNLFFVTILQSIDWDSIQWDKLKPEEKWKLEHMRLHEKHRGHESMHAEMILILFATLVISQIALVKWKQIYPSSYHVSLVVDDVRGQWIALDSQG